MARGQKPILVQLETQGRMTLALLPSVAALPFLSDDALARTFGQTMAILNWTRGIAEATHVPEVLPLPSHIRRTIHYVEALQPAEREPRTREQQREYWREAKRAERQRKRNRQQ